LANTIFFSAFCTYTSLSLVVGQQRWLVAARAVGGRRDERQESVGGGGGRSDDIGGDVVALGTDVAAATATAADGVFGEVHGFILIGEVFG
jgi:hypothetical protein